MTEYVLWHGKVVSVLKRRNTPDGTTPVSLLIQDGETKHSVMPSEVSPYRPGGAKAQAAVAPTAFPVELPVATPAETPAPTLEQEFRQLELDLAAAVTPAVTPTPLPTELPALPDPALPEVELPQDLGKVFINQIVDIAPLTALPTIGRKSAEAILNRRALQPAGRYESLEDLRKVMTQFSYLNWEILAKLLIFD